MTGSNHIDHETLATLQEVMEEDFQRLIETFLSDSQQRIQDMQKALAAGLAEELRRAAHSFKGSSSNIGANELVRLCKNVEDRAQAGILQDLESQIIDIKEEYQIVKSQLDIYL
ncbi:Hpt domain-containing protein [Gilvimarinus sp. 1_MG-2023]|uniref:Hpt domain-containing protein n=1 Tax=Gilvimarinus sp. 1_MG-2023 TaxID=3062638 RepID=UPI0026E29B83|nr:Hpt domain-containing protein [Gilvimarinus sp. 1_MG-2023]MDO6745959.1 Hpt domain-containing protein [Gilvimarinus sp. 1_MG-2023]